MRMRNAFTPLLSQVRGRRDIYYTGSAGFDMSFFKPRTSNTSGSGAGAPKKVPWAEKYRPKTLDDVAAQDAIVNVLKQTVGHANLPHMLFYGPPGTGKTSTILALAKDLFGSSELVKSRVLELNASDDRGIAVVRDRIKNFARTMVASAPGVPDFKIVVLDEADMMTQDAQSALRRTMETYSKITRFCLVCNYVTRIIDPLASRCSKFRFQELSRGDAVGRLKHICTEENVTLANDQVLHELLRTSQGDLRRAITLLQSAAGLLAPGEPVTERLIDELSGTVPDEIVTSVGEAIQKANQRNLENVISNVVLEGWSVATLIDQLHDVYLTRVDIPSKAKSMIAQTLSEADRRLVDGSDEHIELLNVATAISQALK